MRKLLSIVLCLAMLSSVITILPVTVTAATYSGTCGTNLTWTLDTSSGVLTISGTGDMDDYGRTYTNGSYYIYITTAPWGSYSSNVRTVTIESGVTSIGNYAFYKCSSLTSIDIPDSVTEIGYYAFDGCTSLESIIVDEGNSVYHSDGNCIIERGSKKLVVGCKSSIIPFDGSVTSIGDDAFSGCKSLKSIGIPDSVISIGRFTFSDCSSLTSIEIPDSVTSIGYKAFSGCTSLKYNVYDNAKYLGNSTNPYVVLISATSKSISSCEINSNTKLIYEYAFDSCSLLTSISIPDSVTSIGDHAFYYCESLTSISIPDSVTSIGDHAFSGCSSLTYNIYDNALYLGNSTNPYLWLIEASDYDISSCTINNSTRCISSSAFFSCSSLKSVTIPASVTSIEIPAFFGCTSLESIIVDEGNSVYHSDGNCIIKSGSKKLVAGCKSSIIPFDGSVTSIGDYAFGGCPSLTSIEIPDSVTWIGEMAFYGCTSLTSVNIADSVTSIGSSAFSYCDSLTSVTIPASVTSIGDYAFYGCDSLTSIIIPDSVTSIGDYAFYGCSNLSATYYYGSRADWSKISIGNDNVPLRKRIIYNAYCAINGHDWGLAEVSELTCTKDGYTKYMCSRCEEIKYENYTYAPGHDPAEAVEENRVEKTCTAAGSYDYVIYCIRCGDEVSREKFVIPASHTVARTEIPATCTEDGMYFEECSVCGELLDSGIIEAGHKRVRDKKVEPTCTSTGLTAGSHCSVCGVVFTAQEVIPALGHMEYAVEMKATCTESGLVETRCGRCGEKLGKEVIEPLGHDVVREEKAATCTQSGMFTEKCARCKKTIKGGTIPALGHSFSTAAKYCLNGCGAENPDYVGGHKIICDGLEIGEYDFGETVTLPVPSLWKNKNNSSFRFFTWEGAEVARGKYDKNSGTANGRTYTLTMPEGDVALTPVYSYVGDANGDNRVNSKDLIEMKKIIAGYILPGAAESDRADLDCNGRVESRDVAALKKLFANNYDIIK